MSVIEDTPEEIERKERDLRECKERWERTKAELIESYCEEAFKGIPGLIEEAVDKHRYSAVFKYFCSEYYFSPKPIVLRLKRHFAAMGYKVRVKLYIVSRSEDMLVFCLRTIVSWPKKPKQQPVLPHFNDVRLYTRKNPN